MFLKLGELRWKRHLGKPYLPTHPEQCTRFSVETWFFFHLCASRIQVSTCKSCDSYKAQPTSTGYNFIRGPLPTGYLMIIHHSCVLFKDEGLHWLWSTHSCTTKSKFLYGHANTSFGFRLCRFQASPRKPLHISGGRRQPRTSDKGTHLPMCFLGLVHMQCLCPNLNVNRNAHSKSHSTCIFFPKWYDVEFNKSIPKMPYHACWMWFRMCISVHIQLILYNRKCFVYLNIIPIYIRCK